MHTTQKQFSLTGVSPKKQIPISNARRKIAVVCAAGALFVAGCGQGTSRVANSTPEAAAKSLDNATLEAAATSLVKAMIAGDSKAIEALNKSGVSFPTNRLLENANSWGMIGTDISDYEIIKKGDNGVLVNNKKTGKVVCPLHFMFADGGYYFISFQP